MTCCPLRPLAVCLALLGQLAGAFGLPAVRGASEAPDAACGCCPADRTAGRCCCNHGPEPAAAGSSGNDVAPCCRGKKTRSAGPARIMPTLRSKCRGPHDAVPESVVPASIPPKPAAGWNNPADAAGRAPVGNVMFRSISHVPDDPPPRAG